MALRLPSWRTERARVWALGAVTLAAALWLGWGADAVARASMRSRQGRVWSSGVYDEATFARLVVRPDDFLELLPFGGETFAEFATSHARGSFGRDRVELVTLEPSGELETTALDVAARLIEALVGRRVERTSRAPLDAWRDGDAWNGVTMAAGLATPGVLRVGVVARTISVTDFPWVFGYTDVEGGVSVVSFAELPDDAERLAFQLGSLVLHEVGHALGLEHCVFYECVMTPAVSVARTEELGARFCPVCLRKIAHVLGRDAHEILVAMERALRESELETDAERARTQLDALSAHGLSVPWR